MIFTETVLKGAFIVDIEGHADTRGFFARLFCQNEFRERGLNPRVAQANVAFSRVRGTVRGLHFQFPPAAESKLVRVTRGRILDVIVDLRPESPTYLQHVSAELTADNHRSLFVPERFAHGFQVLDENTETAYLMGEFYNPDFESGIRHDDPDLAINWPLHVEQISAKDAGWPLLRDRADELRQRMAPSVTAG